MELSPVKIKSIKKVPWEGIVYNLAVNEDETYIANGIVAHNCRSILVPIFHDEMEEADSLGEPPATQREKGGFLTLK